MVWFFFGDTFKVGVDVWFIYTSWSANLRGACVFVCFQYRWIVRKTLIVNSLFYVDPFNLWSNVNRVPNIIYDLKKFTLMLFALFICILRWPSFCLKCTTHHSVIVSHILTDISRLYLINPLCSLPFLVQNKTSPYSPI